MHDIAYYPRFDEPKLIFLSINSIELKVLN